MRIAVCLDTSFGGLSPRPYLGADAGEPDGKIYLTDEDKYAIDAAVRVRSGSSDDLVGLAVVPQSAATALRDALALGVDRVVTLSHDSELRLDLVGLSHAISVGLKALEADLVIFGPQSEDAGLPLWASVAQAMGIPSVGNVSEFSRDDNGLQATFQSQLGNLTVRVPIPGVMGVATTDAQMRYVSMRDRAAARSKPITNMPLPSDALEGIQGRGDAVLVGQVDRATQREARVVKGADDPAGSVVEFLAEMGIFQ